MGTISAIFASRRTDNIADCASQPNLVCGALGITMTRCLRSETNIHRNGPVDAFNDIEQGSLRAARQKGEAAHHSSLGLNQPGASQRLKDLRKKALRRLRRLGQQGFGDDRSLRLAGQMDHHANGIVGGTGQLHEVYGKLDLV